MKKRWIAGALAVGFAAFFAACDDGAPIVEGLDLYEIGEETDLSSESYGPGNSSGSGQIPESISDIVFAVPPASFCFVNVDTIFAGDSATWYYESRSGKEETFSWVFPEGPDSTSAEKSPTITYPYGGQYSGKVIVKFKDGSKDEEIECANAANVIGDPAPGVSSSSADSTVSSSSEESENSSSSEEGVNSSSSEAAQSSSSEEQEGSSDSEDESSESSEGLTTSSSSEETAAFSSSSEEVLSSSQEITSSDAVSSSSEETAESSSSEKLVESSSSKEPEISSSSEKPVESSSSEKPVESSSSEVVAPSSSSEKPVESSSSKEPEVSSSSEKPQESSSSEKSVESSSSEKPVESSSSEEQQEESSSSEEQQDGSSSSFDPREVVESNDAYIKYADGTIALQVTGCGSSYPAEMEFEKETTFNIEGYCTNSGWQASPKLQCFGKGITIEYGGQTWSNVGDNRGDVTTSALGKFSVAEGYQVFFEGITLTADDSVRCKLSN